MHFLLSARFIVFWLNSRSDVHVCSGVSENRTISTVDRLRLAFKMKRRRQEKLTERIRNAHVHTTHTHTLWHDVFLLALKNDQL